MVGFTATVADVYDNEVTNATILWQASQELGMIDASGLLFASTLVASGTVNATSPNATGVSAGASVSIVPGPVAHLALVVPGLLAGGGATFSASPQDRFGNPIGNATVSWSASAGSVTPLDASGIQVRYDAPRAMGTYEITASSGAVLATAEVIVDHGPLETLSVQSGSDTIVAGGTLRFTATARDAFGNLWTAPDAVWAASRGAVASDGTFTGPTATGPAVITATMGGVAARAEALVVPASLHRIVITPSDPLLRPGDRVVLRAAAYDAYGNAIPQASFAWSPPQGLEVSPDGESATFVAGDAGTTTIVVSAAGVSASVTAVVANPPPVSDPMGPALGPLLLAGLLAASFAAALAARGRRRRSRRPE